MAIEHLVARRRTEAVVGVYVAATLAFLAIIGTGDCTHRTSCIDNQSLRVMLTAEEHVDVKVLKSGRVSIKRRCLQMHVGK